MWLPTGLQPHTDVESVAKVQVSIVSSCFVFFVFEVFFKYFQIHHPSPIHVSIGRRLVDILAQIFKICLFIWLCEATLSLFYQDTLTRYVHLMEDLNTWSLAG